MKRMCFTIIILLIPVVINSQIVAGIGFANSHNQKRTYSNVLNGLDFNLKYNLKGRVALVSNYMIFNNTEVHNIIYKNWNLNFNCEINFINKDFLKCYTISGLSYQKETLKFIVNGNNDPSFPAQDKSKNVLSLNIGLGSQYKIYKKIWIKLNLQTNLRNEILFNPGILYAWSN